MDYQVQLYKGIERQPVGGIPFIPLVQSILEQIFNRSLAQTKILIQVVKVPEEETVYTHLPIIENLVPDYGYAYIQVFAGSQLIYQHPHTISDIVALPLRQLLAERFPDEEVWGFRVDIPGMPPLRTIRPVPEVGGVIEIDTGNGKTKTNFNIKRIPTALPEARSLADFGIIETPTDSTGNVKVVVSPEVHKVLTQSQAFSNEVEEGGFLLGQAYADQEVEEGYIVHIFDTPLAQYTGASLLEFTFTGDSFAAIKQMLRQSNDTVRLIGWYHTHLFPATDDFGLSSIDVKLHLSTFTLEWQVAGLINLDDPAQNARTLRFYIAEDQQMVECPYWVSGDTG